MIKLEKRLEQYCEDCEMFAPCSMKLREKQDDNSYAIKAVVMCKNVDICSNAVHQYQKQLINMTAMVEFESAIENISDQSPCKDCEISGGKELFCEGCKAYYKWKGINIENETD